MYEKTGPPKLPFKNPFSSRRACLYRIIIKRPPILLEKIIREALSHVFLG